MPVGLVKNEIITPPAGAGALSVTLPFIVRPTPSVDESSAMAMLNTSTLTITIPDEKPGAEPAIVVLPTVLPAVTGTLAPVALGGTVMLEGTEAMLGSRFTMVTTCPFGPAGFGSFNV